MKVIWSFFGPLILLVSMAIMGELYVHGDSWAYALLITMTLPLLLVSVGLVFHFIYMLVRRKKLDLWEKILVPPFALLCLLHFLPIKICDYRVNSYNPYVRMVTYWPDMDAWRGGDAYVFRSDSLVECRITHLGYNGELKDTFRYVRRGDSLFFKNDTFLIKALEKDSFHIEADVLFGKRGKVGYVIFDKDKDSRSRW